MKKKLIIVAILVVFLQVFCFRFITPWGDGLAPLYVPAIVTSLYALWSKEEKLSFLVGFCSLMAMFAAPMLFYMKLPPINAIIPMLGWGVIFGFLGLGVTLLEKKLIRKVE